MAEQSSTPFAKYLLILFLLFAQLVVSMFVLSPEFMVRQVNTEHQMTASVMGQGQADLYVQRAESWYRVLFVDTRIVQLSYDLYIPNTSKPQHGLEGMGGDAFTFFERSLDSMWTIIYGALMRLCIILDWLPFFLPLMLPLIVNGLMVRQVKKLNYGYASPVRFTYSYGFIRSSFWILPFYLLLPFAVTPLLPIVWITMVSGAMLILFANLQKMI